MRTGETPTTTAHQHWDAVWRTAQGRATWSNPDPSVIALVPLLRARGAHRVLDLGCGPGRHALFLTTAGFSCAAVDASVTAIAGAAEAAERAGVALDLHRSEFDALPFEPGAFDYVLAFNAVYHGDEAAAGAALAEVHRVLRPGGLYQSTMLSKRNSQFGRGLEIAPNTFVQPDGGEDKAHPHLYCDAADLVRLHAGFELLSAEVREHGAPGSHHWHCLFEKQGGGGHER